MVVQPKCWMSAKVGVLAPLYLLNSLILNCFQPSPEVWILCDYSLYYMGTYDRFTVKSHLCVPRLSLFRCTWTRYFLGLHKLNQVHYPKANILQKKSFFFISLLTKMGTIAHINSHYNSLSYLWNTNILSIYNLNIN